jgi:hypothetical protein
VGVSLRRCLSLFSDDSVVFLSGSCLPINPEDRSFLLVCRPPPRLPSGWSLGRPGSLAPLCSASPPSLVQGEFPRPQAQDRPSRLPQAPRSPAAPYLGLPPFSRHLLSPKTPCIERGPCYYSGPPFWGLTLGMPVIRSRLIRLGPSRSESVHQPTPTPNSPRENQMVVEAHYVNTGPSIS